MAKRRARPLSLDKARIKKRPLPPNIELTGRERRALRLKFEEVKEVLADLEQHLMKAADNGCGM